MFIFYEFRPFFVQITRALSVEKYGTFAGSGSLSRLTILCSCQTGYILHAVHFTATFRRKDFCITVIAGI